MSADSVTPYNIPFRVRVNDFAVPKKSPLPMAITFSPGPSAQYATPEEQAVNAKLRKPSHFLLSCILLGKRKHRGRFRLGRCVPRLLKSGSFFSQFLLTLLALGLHLSLFSFNSFLLCLLLLGLFLNPRTFFRLFLLEFLALGLHLSLFSLNSFLLCL